VRISFKILLTQFAFGIQSSEVIFSLVSIRCFSALKFSLAKMASESARLTSQNGISASLRTSWLPLVSSPAYTCKSFHKLTSDLLIHVFLV